MSRIIANFAYPVLYLHFSARRLRFTHSSLLFLSLFSTLPVAHALSLSLVLFARLDAALALVAHPCVAQNAFRFSSFLKLIFSSICSPLLLTRIFMIYFFRSRRCTATKLCHPQGDPGQFPDGRCCAKCRKLRGGLQIKGARTLGSMWVESLNYTLLLPILVAP